MYTQQADAIATQCMPSDEMTDRVAPNTTPVQQMLADARDMLDDALRHRALAACPEVYVLESNDTAREAARRLVLGAQNHIDCVLPMRPEGRVILAEFASHLVRGHHAEDVTVQVLLSGGASMPAAGRCDFGRIHGAHATEIRVAPAPMPELLIADDAALLTTTGGRGRRIIEVRDGELVQALRASTSTLWTFAHRIPQPRQCEHRECQLADQILESLSAGKLDETAAQQLGLSVRTYRRHVAAIMKALGATTRFQAGMLARYAPNTPCIHSQCPTTSKAPN